MAFGRVKLQQIQEIRAEHMEEAVPVLDCELQSSSILGGIITPSDCLIKWDEL